MNIALTSSYQAARAKTLLGGFYGILFDPLLPDDEPEALSRPIIPNSPALDIGNATFEVFPNPTGDILQLYIEYNETLPDKKRATEISIFDTKGSKLFAELVLNAQTSIDVSLFAQGVYFVAAHNGEQHLGTQLFIKR